jgi:hypothetical protein
LNHEAARSHAGLHGHLSNLAAPSLQTSEPVVAAEAVCTGAVTSSRADAGQVVVDSDTIRSTVSVVHAVPTAAPLPLPQAASRPSAQSANSEAATTLVTVGRVERFRSVSSLMTPRRAMHHASAFALIASNSACVIAPLSSSCFALPISPRRRR